MTVVDSLLHGRLPEECADLVTARADRRTIDRLRDTGQPLPRGLFDVEREAPHVPLLGLCRPRTSSVGFSTACERHECGCSRPSRDDAIPADASDIHYVTRQGLAQVSFLSDRMPDHLHRAGLVPEGAPLFDDENYGSAYALGGDERELPEGLCGPALEGPAWSYRSTGPGPGVNITIERSPTTDETFPAPARVIASFDIS
ncbi:hypothetical protein ACWEQP_20650 [Streptomyces sp. NPDC004044]